MFLTKAVQTYNDGGVIGYPTEAVFGLGCDPDNEQAIRKLLKLKQRNEDKGLILIASHYDQLLAYINESAIPESKKTEIMSRWPGAITQILPAQPTVSSLLTGKYNSIAVRITTHPDVVGFCNKINKPIISTSANLSGEDPATSWQKVEQSFGSKIDFIIKGNTLGLNKSSKIINALTGEIIRP